jgi:L-ascorbate metabolism protein UlaG (beta-lactamase superfamily)
LGFAGLAALGTAAYRVSPRFWHQYAHEWDREVTPPTARPNPQAWPDVGLHAAWLGHATVLVKADGFTFLTDPVFSKRAGLNLGPVTLGPKRLVAPAVGLRDLPRLDLLLLSHAHMDHFDIPSLRALEEPSRPVVTAWETADLLRADRYGSVRELRWGGEARVGPARVRAFRVNHWGARMRTDTYRGYNGYTIEVGRWRILFGGDTADTGLFRELKGSRPFDLAIMPIGAYDPWIRYHCTPEQAWRMGNEAGAEFFVPVHHGTFVLSDEPRTEPLERFQSAAARHSDRVAIRSIGEEFHLS